MNTIRVIGLDRDVADRSAVKRWEGDRMEGMIESSDSSELESSGPCQSALLCSGRLCDQEGIQESSQIPMDGSEHECAPLLCRLRMNFREQDSSNIMLQDYRCIVTIIRQEDVDLDVHDNCSLRPCVCGSSCHMPRDKESSAHKKTKPQTLAPKGAISQADDRAKADKEVQTPRARPGEAESYTARFHWFS